MLAGLAIGVLTAMVVAMFTVIVTTSGQTAVVTVVSEPTIVTIARKSCGCNSSDDGSDKDHGGSGEQRQLRRGKKARGRKWLGCGGRTVVPYCVETACGA